REVEISDPRWQRVHWKTLCQLYGKAPCFERYRRFLQEVYLGREWRNLSELNRSLSERVARGVLGIPTGFPCSTGYAAEGSKQDRVLGLLRQLGAETYVSGPAAKAYLQPECLEAAGIGLVWKDYSGYPEYPQLHPPFEHAVTILDLLFNVGSEAPYYIWG